jgi:hypothetical protein
LRLIPETTRREINGREMDPFPGGDHDSLVPEDEPGRWRFLSYQEVPYGVALQIQMGIFNPRRVNMAAAFIHEYRGESRRR